MTPCTKYLESLSSISGRKELLTAINDFLDSSVVLPPGDWDSKNLLSMSNHELLYFLWILHSFEKFQNAIFLEIFEIPAIG